MRLRFVHIALGLMLTAAALTATPSAAEPCPTLGLDAIHPNQGSAGDTVQLKGRGFCGDPQGFFAWGWDGARGFPIEIDGAEPEILSGVVGSVPVDFSGPIRLGSGQLKKLGARSISSRGARYRLSGSILRIHDTTSGGQFSAQQDAGATSSSLDSGTLRLPKPPPRERDAGKKDQKPESEISIVIVVETCGPPDEDDDSDDEDSSTTKPFVGRLDLACHGRDFTCRQPPAKIVTKAIRKSFKPMGLRARVDGEDIVISRPSCPITAGFATLFQD